jgi:hypothetical protein
VLDRASDPITGPDQDHIEMTAAGSRIKASSPGRRAFAPLIRSSYSWTIR